MRSADCLMEHAMEPDYLKTLLEMLQAKSDWRKGNRRARPGWLFAGSEDFVLSHGRPYQWQPLPKMYQGGQFRCCFRNAFDAAERHGLVYVEGYALSEGEHIHAWCAEPDSDLVIDPTWERGEAYFGVAFDLGFVARTLKSRGAYGVLDNWEEGSPVLTLRPEEWTFKG